LPQPMARLAAVEGGGTSFVVAIAVGDPANIVERAEFPTTTPAETLGACCKWLAAREYEALGVASFGPVDLHAASPTYGYITTTPKPGWKNTDVLGPLRRVRPAAPAAFDTDVNAPALAEYLHAQRQGGEAHLSSCAYITVGTGIGVGLVVNGAPVHGLVHPEGGHVCVPRLPSDAAFGGSNPSDCFGGGCAENLACSKALASRAGVADVDELRHLADADPIWGVAAHYLGALCANLVLTASPEKIVLSGGVMLRASLFPLVRAATQKQLNGYIQAPQLTTAEGIAQYIAPSTWGNSAGIVGALTLASQAAASKPPKAPPALSAPLLGALLGCAALTGMLVGRALSR